MDGDGEPVGGVEITLSPTVAGFNAQLFGAWHQRSFGAIRADANGRFQVTPSQLVTRLDVSAMLQTGNRMRWGTVQVDPRKEKKIEIVIQG